MRETLTTSEGVSRVTLGAYSFEKGLSNEHAPQQVSGEVPQVEDSVLLPESRGFLSNKPKEREEASEIPTERFDSFAPSGGIAEPIEGSQDPH